jgi:hypothetical protein
VDPKRAELYRRLAAQDRREVFHYAMAVSRARGRGEEGPTSSEWDATWAEMQKTEPEKTS